MSWYATERCDEEEEWMDVGARDWNGILSHH
jgi:hypothetical protein